jgi:hypothetical protein
LFHPFQPLNLSIYIPPSLPQVLDGIALFTRTPKIFDSIATAKIHVFSDFDALYF